MFNDGGVLPGIMGGPREPSAPTLQQRVCLAPELGRDTHRLPLSPSGQAATTQRNRNLEAVTVLRARRPRQEAAGASCGRGTGWQLLIHGERQVTADRRWRDFIR